MPDNFLHPGGFNLIRLEIFSASTTYDISDRFLEMSIYEDLNANGTSGDILLADQEGLLEQLPLKGNEKIRMTFSNIDDSIRYDKTFDVYKTSDIKIKRNTLYITLHFTSQVVTRSAKSRISLSYSDMAENIIESIIKKTLSLDSYEIQVQPTKYDRNVIIPNWTSLQAINYLSQTSVPNDSKRDLGSVYRFFEDRDGFTWATPEYLILTRPVHQLKAPLTKEQADAKDYGSVLSLRINTVFDNLDSLRKGSQACTVHAHDIIGKTVSSHQVNINDSYSSSAEMSRHPIADDTLGNPDQAHEITSINYDRRNFIPVLQSKHYNERYDQLTYTAELPGNFGVTVGDVASMPMPSYQIGKDDNSDYLPSKYLITELRHVITLDGHTTYVKLAADGVNK